MDDLVGKGLEWDIIAQLLLYASAGLIPLALPLATLLASIMTFGNMGEHYELVAMKSAGLSLQRIMLPLIIIVIFISGGVFLYANYVWPVANLEMRTILYDVTHKKPALEIKENVFYKGIEDYVIRVNKKEEDGQTLNGITIYDHSAKQGNKKVIKAKSGKMQMSSDERFLILTLYNGNSYEDRPTERGKKNTHPFFRSTFQEEIIRFDLSSFAFMKSDKDIFKDNYEMLNMKQLNSAIDTLNMQIAERKQESANFLLEKFYVFNIDTNRGTIIKDTNITTKTIRSAFSLHHKKLQKNLATREAKTKEDLLLAIDKKDTLLATENWLQKLPKAQKRMLVETAVVLANNAHSYSKSLNSIVNSKIRSRRRHYLEWHKKLTFSVASLILFFIGAPLGAIIRKGGLGLPVVISVLFFLVFHVLSITGEKLVKQGEAEAFWGMWIASAVLTPIGIFLTYKATTDSALLDMEAYSKFFRKFKSKFFSTTT